MPPPAKKRRTTGSTSHHSNVPAAQRGIQAFGKITKTRLLEIDLKNKIEQEGPSLPAGITQQETGQNQWSPTRESATEKTQSFPKSGEGEENSPSSPEPIPTPRRKVSIPTSLSCNPPVTPRKEKAERPEPAETPTQGARSCLGKLALSSSSSKRSKRSTLWTLSLENEASSPPSPALSSTRNPTLSDNNQVSPLLAKGRRHLIEIKAAAIQAQQGTQTRVKPSNSDRELPTGVTSRKQTLLDRIVAKQLYQASLPPPISTENVARKAALQRLEDIIPVIHTLASAGDRMRHGGANGREVHAQKTSFTMPTLVQYLKNSLRHPIAKDEVERCMGLLAEEVAPGWIRRRVTGKVVSWTVDRGGTVGREEIGQRISKALEL